METIGPFYGYVVRGFAIPNTPSPQPVYSQYLYKGLGLRPTNFILTNRNYLCYAKAEIILLYVLVYVICHAHAHNCVNLTL